MYKKGKIYRKGLYGKKSQVRVVHDRSANI